MPADAPALASFAARTFAATFGAANESRNLALHLASKYGVEQQGRELADPSYVTLLIDVDGAIAGYVQLRRGEAPSCVTARDPVEIYRFYIDAPWYGQGLAQRLMTAATDAARDMGAGSIWLAVWEENPRAIAFYEKSGFRDVGKTTFVLGTDVQRDRVMVTELRHDLTRS